MTTKLLFLFLLVSCNVFTQTLTMLQSNEPSVGMSQTMYDAIATTNSLDNNTGSNVTWDYSMLVGAGTSRTVSVIDPALSTYSALFPTATKGFSIQNAVVNFYSSTANERLSHGFVFLEPSLGTFRATFDMDKQQTVSYPFNLGSSLSDPFSGSLKFSLYNIPQTPACTGKSYATIDGQGTLLLPSGNTFTNVIRYCITDTVFTQVQILQKLLDLKMVRKQYEYYDLTNSSLPVFTYTKADFVDVATLTPITTQTVVLSLIEPTAKASIDEWSSSTFSIAPNPAREQIIIQFKGNHSQMLTISDLSGRVVKRAMDVSNGDVISLSDIPSGTYLVRLNESSLSEKIIIP